MAIYNRPLPMNQSAPASAAPTVFIETYGCQMNVADSQTISAILRTAGYAIASAPDHADVILLNTCAIRDRAEERELGRLSNLAHLKRSRPALKLGLLGCVAQHNRASIVEKAGYLDIIAGPDAYRRLPEMLANCGIDPEGRLLLLD